MSEIKIKLRRRLVSIPKPLPRHFKHALRTRTSKMLRRSGALPAAEAMFHPVLPHAFPTRFLSPRPLPSQSLWASYKTERRNERIQCRASACALESDSCPVTFPRFSADSPIRRMNSTHPFGAMFGRRVTAEHLADSLFNRRCFLLFSFSSHRP